MRLAIRPAQRVASKLESTLSLVPEGAQEQTIISVDKSGRICFFRENCPEDAFG
jgi:hypothetical protein